MENEVLDSGAECGLNHQQVLSESFLHECVLGLFHFFGSDSQFGCDCLLTLDHQHFGVSEVLDQSIDVLLGLLEDASLFGTPLLGESLVLGLDQILSVFHNLGVGLDMQGVDCSWQVLHCDSAAG